MVKTKEMDVFKKVFLVGILTLLLGCGKPESEGSYLDSTLPAEQRASLLVKEMTLQEKVKQMRIFHANEGIELDESGNLRLSDKSKALIKNGIAGIKNTGTELPPEEAAKLCNQLQTYVMANNRLNIPALFITECYNGVDAKGATLFSRPITMSASFNPHLVHTLWDFLGREARARGFHMCHSPEGDLVRDPRFGRMSETFGEDPFLTSTMLVQAVKGVQGDYDGLAKGTHIGAVTKHFAGYAQVEGGKNFASMQMSPRSFIDEILPPFEAAVKEGKTLGIMASHADLNGVASHCNPVNLRTILKQQWGFSGYVVSDATDIERLHHFMKVAESYEDAAEMALRAGMDIDLYGKKGYVHLEELATKKPDLLKYIDEAVKRVLLTKFRLGLFEHPYIDEKAAKTITRSKEALDFALSADLESIILLKNKAKILPLKKHGYRSIAVIGPNANAKNIQYIKEQVGAQTRVSYAKGCGIAKAGRPPKLYRLNEDEPEIKKAVALANRSDLVILFVGGNEYTAKEAFFSGAIGDRESLRLVGQQDLLIDELKKTGKKIIAVLEHRRTLSAVNLDMQADAIIDCWDLSERGEEAMAKVLFGEVNPSGKMPVTVPRSVGQLPAYYYQKHINYKKTYLFADCSPLYPFAYGLSYTDFSFSKLQLSDTLAKVGEPIRVSVQVKNTGNVAGKEVCQVYLQDEYASVVQPIRLLKGFEKIALQPGESKKVEFTIQPEMMSFTGVDMKKVIEPGIFHVYVGNSSLTQYKKSFRLTP